MLDARCRFLRRNHPRVSTPRLGSSVSVLAPEYSKRINRSIGRCFFTHHGGKYIQIQTVLIPNHEILYPSNAPLLLGESKSLLFRNIHIRVLEIRPIKTLLKKSFYYLESLFIDRWIRERDPHVRPYSTNLRIGRIFRYVTDNSAIFCLNCY